jgi:hypothetical protein
MVFGWTRRGFKHLDKKELKKIKFNVLKVVLRKLLER